MSSSTERLLPSEYIPRIEKFLDKLATKEIDEAKFVGFIEALIRPALTKSSEDPELKATIERQVKPLLGMKVWINAKNQNPVVIEIAPPSELLKFYLSTEEEVKRRGLPGASYDPLLLKDALHGKFNPLLALASGKIKITGLPELIKIGAPLVSALKPFKDNGSIMGELRREILSSLDSLLEGARC
jgi:hypothetical protein